MAVIYTIILNALVNVSDEVFIIYYRCVIIESVKKKKISIFLFKETKKINKK